MTTFGADPNYQKKLAVMLMQQGVDASPVQHWTQGAARMAQALVGGNMMRSEREADDEANRNAMASLLGGSQSAAQPQPMQQQQPAAHPVSNPQSWANAISGIESSGKYDALGPVTKTGDRAYGKYQVMGANVPQWTKAHLGQEMTPEQFAANPQAQDAVFKGQFGQYAQKYGPEGAAKAWFAGEGGMNNPNAKDQLGTSVAQYAQKFNGALPGQQAQAAPQQMAQAPQAPQIDRNAAMAAILNPRVRPEVKQMLMQHAIPKDHWVDERGPDGSFYQRNRLTGERKVIEKSDVLPQAAVDQKIAIAQASKPETTINNTVNPLLKGVGDRFNDTMEKARSSSDQVRSIHEARRALDEGAITGAGADPKLFLAKTANMFGLKSDVAANTEVLRGAVGNSVLDRAKALGANPSNADRDYIEKVAGGSIALEEGSIRRLLDMQEKWARDTIRRANNDGKKLLGAQPKELAPVAGLLTIDEPLSYDDFLKSNPMQKPRVQNPAPSADGWITAPNGARIRERR